MAYTWHIHGIYLPGSSYIHFRWVPMADGDPIVKALQRRVQEMEGGGVCISGVFTCVYQQNSNINQI